MVSTRSSNKPSHKVNGIQKKLKRNQNNNDNNRRLGKTFRQMKNKKTCDNHVVVPVSTEEHSTEKRYNLRRKLPMDNYLSNYHLPRKILRNNSFSANIASHYLEYTLPNELLLHIMSYLSEVDICHFAQVCKKFNILANDSGLWRNLYQSVFEYDVPLMHPSPCLFEFLKVEDFKGRNAWKESFKQLYCGIHVRPNYKPRQGSLIKYFNTIRSALEFLKGFKFECTVKNPCACGLKAPALIFVHSGIYEEDCLDINRYVQLVCCAPGNVMESIILERESESFISYQAHTGHMTLKFFPGGSDIKRHKNCCFDLSHTVIHRARVPVVRRNRRVPHFVHWRLRVEVRTESGDRQHSSPKLPRSFKPKSHSQGLAPILDGNIEEANGHHYRLRARHDRD